MAMTAKWCRRVARGVAATEFALALPPFVVIMMGTAELSHFMSQLYVVQRAARDGARVGSITLLDPGDSPTLIEGAAEDQAEFILATSGRSCDPPCDVDANWYIDDGWFWVTVDVSYPHDAFAPALGIVPTTATAKFTMLTQQQTEP